MMNGISRTTARVSVGLALCLFGTGVTLAEPAGHAGGGGAPAAAPAHAAPETPSAAPSGADRSNTAGETDSNRAATVGGGDRQPDHRPHNPNHYYPLGPAYNYFDPGWNSYGYGYAYNQPTYQGQFDQPDTSVAEPSEQPDAVIPQHAPDSESPTLHSALMSSPQWRAADEQVHVAQAEYDAASGRVLAQLRTKPAYQQALERKQQDAQRLATLKAKDPDPSIAKADPAATAKLDAAKTVTDMETAALAADPQASAAKAKLDVALAQRLEARQAVEAQFPRAAGASGGQ